MSSSLKNTVFKVIPMMNPDGVVCGNYRSNLAGLDLNRCFREKLNPLLFPDLTAFLKMIETLGSNVTFIDLHGHSIKRNAFIYGPYFQNKMQCS